MAENINDVLADALEKAIGVRPERELSFHPTRRWRIDCAYPEQKIAVEVDGSRHLSFPQQRKDAEKQNALTELGWIVLRYPASAVRTKCRLPLIVQQIRRVLSGVRSPEGCAHVLTG